MIGTIGSLVQEASYSKRWIGAFVLYTVACFSSSLLLGIMLSGVGIGIQHLISENSISLGIVRIGYIVSGGVALVYALSDLGFFRFPRPTLMKAVPVTWWRWWRPYGASLAYGFALGMGITTHIHFGSFYILCILCILKANVLYGTVLLGIYGAFRALTLFPASQYVYQQKAGIQYRLTKLLACRKDAVLVAGQALFWFGIFIVLSKIF